MTLFLNDDIDAAQWNLLAGSHVFHQIEWRKIITDAYGLTPSFTMAIDEEYFALFPSFRIKNRYVSMPFTYLTGFLSNSDILCEVIRNKLEVGNFRLSYKIAEARATSDGTITAVIEVDDLAAYLGGLSQKMRNQLRLSDKQGLVIRRERSIEEFYPLYCRKMHDHGTPPHSRLFFEGILKYFQTASVWTASKDGKACASLLCIEGDDNSAEGARTLYVLWAAAVSDDEVPYANYFAYWSVIRDAVANGIMRIDLGTALYGSGQHNFKKKWKPVVYAVRQIGGGGHHYKESHLMQIASRLWRNIPEPLANRFGPSIRKYLP